MVVGLRTCEEHRYDFESQANFHQWQMDKGGASFTVLSRCIDQFKVGSLGLGCIYGGQKGRNLLFCICMQLLKNGGVNRDAATKTAECISYAL